jgi:FkbM family methyltransferase
MNDMESNDLIVVQAIFGEVLAFKGDFITAQLLEYGAHIRCELAFLSHFVDLGDVVVDVGAHIGTFALPLAQKAGKAGRVIAVEADPRNYAVLVANVERAGLSGNVRTLNAIVGDPGESYDLVRNPANTGMSQPVLTSAENPMTAQGICFEEVVKDEPRIEVIKSPCRGWSWTSFVAPNRRSNPSHFSMSKCIVKLLNRRVRVRRSSGTSFASEVSVFSLISASETRRMTAF